MPGVVSLYFQRAGDNWRARRGTEYYRWYAPSATVQALRPGVAEMRVDLNDPGWLPVVTGQPSECLWRRQDAWRNASALGLVFGSTEARGHGVFATGPARFTLLSMRID